MRSLRNQEVPHRRIEKTAAGTGVSRPAAAAKQVLYGPQGVYHMTIINSSAIVNYCEACELEYVGHQCARCPPVPAARQARRRRARDHEIRALPNLGRCGPVGNAGQDQQPRVVRVDPGRLSSGAPRGSRSWPSGVHRAPPPGRLRSGPTDRRQLVRPACCLTQKCFRNSVSQGLLACSATKYETGHRRWEDSLQRIGGADLSVRRPAPSALSIPSVVRQMAVT